MNGIFISFEGNDGSGKSSVIKAVNEKLIALGYDVVMTREPGGTVVAEKIRTIILDKDNLGMDVKTESLLYAASRREHLIKIIKPALDAGKIVLCDRFVDSSLAYQGIARGIGFQEVYDMNMYAIEDMLPNLTIYVCVKPEIGLSRINYDHRDLDRLELEGLSLQQKVYAGYQLLVKKYPERIKVIDGEKPKEMVCKEAIEIILSYVKGR